MSPEAASLQFQLMLLDHGAEIRDEIPEERDKPSEAEVARARDVLTPVAFARWCKRHGVAEQR
jgi:hypothetical protein